MNLSYQHPPITEAVIEFRYAGNAPNGAFERAARRLSSNFPKSEDVQPIEITFRPGASEPTSSPVGHIVRKMTSADGSHLVQLHPDRVALSRLAPYLGWEPFVAEYQSVLSLASAVVKGRAVNRIGVRYLNRIDVPVAADGIFDHSKYISIGLAPMPFEHGEFGAMSFSASTVLDGGKFGLTLNCGKAFSPLVGHGAISLDIEVFNQANLPTAQADIWDQVNEMRAWKNRVFEGSLTTNSRKLFE